MTTRTLTDEHKQKISEGNKGKKLTDITKGKMAQSAKARGISPEQQAKMAQSRIGRIMPEDNKAKLQAANSTPIQIGDVVYSGIKDACESLDMSRKAVIVRLDSDKYPDWKRLSKP